MEYLIKTRSNLREISMDDRETKLSLLMGTYRDESGRPFVFSAVKEAERRILEDDELDHEYLPIEGHGTFNQLATELLLGVDHPALVERRFFTFQTVGGSGALRAGAEFCRKWLGIERVLLPKHTYLGHHCIFKACGYQEETYRYFDLESMSLDFEGMIEDLSIASPSLVILQACGHNPTGIDPSPDQWRQLVDVISAAGHIPFFDVAYLGFVSGDVDVDAAAPRLFADATAPRHIGGAAGFANFFAAQSFSKSMGLYGDRLGSLTWVGQDAAEVHLVRDTAIGVTIPLWFRSPTRPALIAARILGDEGLRAEWTQVLKAVSRRTDETRKELIKRLNREAPSRSWSESSAMKGMYTILKLSPEEIARMKTQFAIYMDPRGRIATPAMSEENMKAFVSAVASVVEKG